MTEYLEGGRRPLDRILAAGFADASGLDDEELRRRRAEAEQEETDLSYERRLLQGRLDLLRAEAERRAAGTPLTQRTDAELVAHLTQVLAEDAPAGTRPRDAHFVTAEPSRVGEHRRIAEAAAADVELSDATHLDDARLASATAELTEMESEISRTRSAVQRVLDELTAAVEERVRRIVSG